LQYFEPEPSYPWSSYSQASAWLQKVATARATIPFKLWAEGHEFQAGDYVFDNEFPSSASIHREGTNSAVGVSIILYVVPEDKENPRLIFVRRDEKYFLVELWGVQARFVVTAEFGHRGEVNEQQRRVIEAKAK
jgi:hypothetical protein